MILIAKILNSFSRESKALYKICIKSSHSFFLKEIFPRAGTTGRAICDKGINEFHKTEKVEFCISFFINFGIKNQFYTLNKIQLKNNNIGGHLVIVVHNLEIFGMCFFCSYYYILFGFLANLIIWI